METSREDFGIAIRSAFLKKGVQQKFSLLLLIIISVFLLIIEKIETKPLNYFRSIVKDAIYRGSIIVASPYDGLKKFKHENASDSAINRRKFNTVRS